METEMHGSLKYYGNREEYTLAWDTTQEQLECCGVKNYRDWQSSIRNVPKSCCVLSIPGGKVSILFIYTTVAYIIKKVQDCVIVDQ